MAEQHASAGGHHPQADMAKLQQRMGQIRHKLLVLSGKGGVGKSTVAVNLAVELARRGFKTGLLDVDLHGPTIPRMTGLAGQQCHAEEGSFEPLEAEENLKVMSIAFMLPDATKAVIWRGPMKYAVIQKLLADTEWGDLDYLVVDAPPGTGDEPLSVAQLVGENAGAVLVTTPQRVAVEDVRRCVTFCRELALPVWGLIENMAWLACPGCAREIRLFGDYDGGRLLAQECGIALLGSLPLEPAVAAAADGGRAIGDVATAIKLQQSLTAIVNQLIQTTKPESLPSKGTPSMKIAIPTSGGRLCAHFGHCDQFTLITVDPATKTIAATETLTPPPHEPGLLPRWIAQQGASLVIAGGMGQRAQQLFVENNIKVVVGATADTPENLVLAHLNNALVTGANACDH